MIPVRPRARGWKSDGPAARARSQGSAADPQRRPGPLGALD